MKSAAESLPRVALLELVIGFELSTGLRCQEDRSEERSWEEKAALLKKVVRSLVQARGIEKGNKLMKVCGDNRQVFTLGGFGARGLGGLDRKPQFVSGLNAVHCIATNAWRAGDASGEFDRHAKADYRGYSSGKKITSKAILALKAAQDKL